MCDFRKEIEKIATRKDGDRKYEKGQTWNSNAIERNERSNTTWSVISFYQYFIFNIIIVRELYLLAKLARILLLR